MQLQSINTIVLKGYYAELKDKYPDRSKIPTQMERKMANIVVRNVGTDFVTTPNGRILHANAAEIYYNGYTVPLPAVIPNQLEMKYAHQSSFGGFDIPIFQHVYYVDFNLDFRDTAIKNQISNNFKKTLDANPNSLGDIFLQYREDYPIKQSHRSAWHEIALKASSKILPDIEVNIEQSAQDFINQCTDLRDNNPDHIIRPILDMGMRTNGLLEEKIKLLIKNKFPCFQARYRPIKLRFKNWIALSNAIAEQNIWCNVVGCTRRWYGKQKISVLAPLFQLGVHSVSFGNLKVFGAFKIQPFQLDVTTLCYNPAPRGVTYPESRADAVFTHDRHLALARRHIINRDFYSYFVKSKDGTRQAFQLLQLLS